jgi:Cof subfamily protein (haloacid dehalogenase superfamily)
MKYKLICIDMDGTLLNSKHKVSEISREAIKKAHDMDLHIVISTGRIYADAEGYSNLVGVKSPVIASNGAIIKEKDKSEVIYKSSIDKDLCIKLLDIFKKHGVKPSINTPDKIYCGDIVMKLFVEYLKVKRVMNKSINLKYIHSWKQWENILNIEKDNIIKCEVINRNTNKINELRKELEKLDNIEIASSSNHNIEVTNKGVSKGKAIEILAKHYNIKREEIIAIGDSENDISMIEFAGVGIAMGNASEKVKKAADFITDTNDNEGVAKAINKYVLGI